MDRQHLTDNNLKAFTDEVLNSVRGNPSMTALAFNLGVLCDIVHRLRAHRQDLMEANAELTTEVDRLKAQAKLDKKALRETRKVIGTANTREAVLRCNMTTLREENNALREKAGRRGQ